MKSIVINKIRIQIFSKNIVRIELQHNGSFCNENTFLVSEKSSFKGYDGYVTVDRGDYKIISLEGYNIYVPSAGKSLSGIYVNNSEGKTVYKYRKTLNSGELPELDKTPEIFTVSDTPRITVPDGGYTYNGDIKDSGYIIQHGVEDVFLLLCNKDAKLLRKLYVSLTGRCELVRLSTLGGWNSKYFAYDEKTAKQLILDYEEHNVPLDVMVIDTDWRKASDRGIGYDIDTKLFPDMAEFLEFAHSHGVDIMFNDHPEPVEGTESVLSPEEVKYREEKLQSLMELGLDIWWYDRNWHTHLLTPAEEIKWETFGLYLFQEVTKHFYQKKAGSKKVYRRPVVMGNVSDIHNGVYRSIGDSASHRYSIQWTGDIASDESALAEEVRSLLKCSDNCIPYVNADCGGHTGNPHKELFVRWMQFGTLSPVFRPHCTMGLQRTREPWVFDEEALGIVRNYNNLRYRLLPVIYRQAYESYENGTPIFGALGYEYPNDKKALKRTDEYMLGKDLLISPVAGDPAKPLAGKDYKEPVKATFYDGREWKGEPIATAEWDTLEMDLDGESPLKGVPVYNFSAVFETTVQFDEPMDMFIRSDDGATVYIDGKCVHEDRAVHAITSSPLGMIEPNVPHKVRIEYFQALGGAYCALTAKRIGFDVVKEVYLPKGKWLEAFGTKIHNGNKIVKKEYPLNTSPLFIRLGSIIPLAYEAKNTKEQKWNKLVYDFYPSKGASDSGYLYEDDTETTAYKLGEYRKSGYSAKFNEKDNCFEVVLEKAEGTFKGKKAYAKRDILIKYHMLPDAAGLKKVTVNGVETEYKTARRSSQAFPLNCDKNACDSSVVNVKLKTDTDSRYVIKFYI